MPIYQHDCQKCNKTHDFFRPVSQAANEERCPNCNGKTSRVYSFATEKEFTPYYDQKFGCEVLSSGTERKLMKKHKQVYTRDALSAFRDKDMIKAKLDKKRWEIKKGINI